MPIPCAASGCGIRPKPAATKISRSPGYQYYSSRLSSAHIYNNRNKKAIPPCAQKREATSSPKISTSTHTHTHAPAKKKNTTARNNAFTARQQEKRGGENIWLEKQRTYARTRAAGSSGAVIFASHFLRHGSASGFRFDPSALTWRGAPHRAGWKISQIFSFPSLALLVLRRDVSQRRRRGGGGSYGGRRGRGGGGRGLIRWDQILPRRSLRVLLVEHDDSTRQVVTALLRKCGYRVAAVADGMKAWEVMRGRAYAFDLVLTEVNMPTLSGIDLLSRIVAADECKNIPVIMMSSQDSIGTVLKCMQNGAVDFLVKPVRKNELRNLWQHVWRRHSMNSQINASENNAASNHISANSANRSKTGENSDEESDAQSSGSKRETEIQSVQKLHEISTDNGASSSRGLNIQNGPFPGVNTKSHAAKCTDDAPSGNVCGISKLQVLSAEKNVRSKCRRGITSAKVAGQIMDNAMRIADASSCRSSDPGKDLLAITQLTADGKCNSPVMKNNAVMAKTIHENSKDNGIGHAESCPSESPEINLGKEHCLNGCTNQEFREKDNFNHSNSSAFSRYGNKRIEPTVKQMVAPSLCITYQESVSDKNIQPSEALPSHEHNICKSTMQAQVPFDSCMEGLTLPCSSSAREDAAVGSSSPRNGILSHHPPYGFIPVPIPVGAAIPYHYGAIMQPIYYSQAPFMQCDSAGITQNAIQHASYRPNYHENLSKPSQVDGHKHLEEIQHSHQSRPVLRESGESIDLERAHAELVNQSASCSQDIQRGSGWTASGETDTNTNTFVALESGNDSGIQNYSNNGFDCDRSRREAALMKFRMKRKDRCFEKKVRYHSRKKLAEQRPRVKGQFVSQKLKSATTTEDAETD